MLIGDGEADALARRDDGGIDADHLALEVDERAAGVAGIDRGVGLDEVLVGGDAHVGAPGGADDPHRHRLVQPEGVADGDGPLADPEGVRIAQAGHAELVVGLEADEGEVGFRVGPEDLAPVFSLVGEPHRDLVGALDHVEVGEDESPLVDDDARPEAGLAELGRGVGCVGAEELIEEVVEEGIVVALRHDGAAPALRALDRAQVHDGGPQVLRHVHEAELQGLGEREAAGGLRAARHRRGGAATEAIAQQVPATPRGDQEDGDHGDQYRAAAHVCTLPVDPGAANPRGDRMIATAISDCQGSR